MFKRLQKQVERFAGWRHAKRGAFYRKSLILILLTASIPGFVTGAFIYWFSVAGIERDLNAMHQRQIDERVDNIDDQLGYLEMDLSHWAFSPRFGYPLQELDFVYHFQETWDISKSLVILQGSHPLIQDVELYIRPLQEGDAPVLFNTGFHMLRSEAQARPYEEQLADSRKMYWSKSGQQRTADGLDRREPIRLVHHIPGESTRPFGVLTITVNQEKMVNLLKTMTPYNEGATFLMEGTDHVIVSDNRASSQALYSELREEVTRRVETAGKDTFLWEREGKTYSVSYGSFLRVDKGWTYVSAAPVTAITGPVVMLSNTILIVSSAGLIVALLLSWLASLRMYSPIARLMRRLGGAEAPLREVDEFQYIEGRWQSAEHRSLHLQEKLDDQLPHLRSGFLQQLLQGHLYAYSEQDLRTRLQRYGWETEGHQFQLLHVRLTGYSRMTERFPRGDESLVTFAAANIVEELTEAAFARCDVMNFHDLSLCVMIVSERGSQTSEALEALGSRVTETINRILQLQVTLTISRPIEQLRLISATFMEVERASGSRPFVNQNQTIRLGDLDESTEAQAARYPFALELELVQTMRSGQGSAVRALVDRFYEELVAYRMSEVQIQQSLLQLLGSLQHMMLQAGIVPYQLFAGANLFEELSQMRDPEKMVDWLKERVALPFIAEREARASRQLREVVEQTVAHLQEHYMTPVSLESCADRVGVNSYTLSKLFKSVTGVNFIDYLTELRIAKAKELLRESEMQINLVAEAVGYQQRYFNRIFKKHAGVTPSEYRGQATGS
ncbi:AraC family transcriptional regulator [Paenibacillus sp. 598K]|uniref:AraC family transcriptional regulator n=1 Tax=Paenibacillus sp. 598K TaxID=1117987 RepID=UPI000FF93FD5|nr:AraC family transcriptional regulator [Paenibacillus sp. 598K]GBF77202.1 AraC family transcriptional regulator [Paenibacillus sp. 598K]